MSGRKARNIPLTIFTRPPHVLNIETKGGQAVCQRCYALRHSGRVIPIRVPFAELKDHLRVLSTMPVLVVKIVDIFDFSGSFIPDFHFIVGNNPVILVGNKVDLLPDGASDERVRTWLKKLSKDLGLRNVRAVHLISALTGAGISDLSRVSPPLAETTKRITEQMLITFAEDRTGKAGEGRLHRRLHERGQKHAHKPTLAQNERPKAPPNNHFNHPGHNAQFDLLPDWRKKEARSPCDPLRHPRNCERAPNCEFAHY